jgi:hypothetical protein
MERRWAAMIPAPVEAARSISDVVWKRRKQEPEHTKSEARNSKSETILNDQNSK